MILSCHGFDGRKSAKQQDVFYTDKGGILDQPRIPLIKPYELKKVSENEWRLKLKSVTFALSFDKIEGVKVTEGKLLVYSSGTQIRLDTIVRIYDQAWLIIDPQKQEEIPYISQVEYSTALARLKIKDTVLAYPDPLYQRFCESGKVVWK